MSDWSGWWCWGEVGNPFLLALQGGGGRLGLTFSAGTAAEPSRKRAAGSTRGEAMADETPMDASPTAAAPAAPPVDPEVARREKVLAEYRKVLLQHKEVDGKVRQSELPWTPSPVDLDPACKHGASLDASICTCRLAPPPSTFPLPPPHLSHT